MAVGNRRGRGITVADVAREAGVGKATASRALGGYGQVSEGARERVLAAAERLGYRPNEIARSMNTGRTKTLGVVIGDIENSYFGLAMRGIADVARAAGYSVLLMNTSERAQDEIDAVRVLRDKRVDAIICSPASAHVAEHLKETTASGLPLVLLDRHLEGVEAPVVEVHTAPAARRAAQLLLEAGHTHIAFLSSLQTDGPNFRSFPLGNSSVTQRLEGIVDALDWAGLPVDPELFRFQADSAEATQRIVGELLEQDPPPTALIVSDSVIVLDVLRELRERGLRVPDDLSLIVFDNPSWTAFTDPPLTVVAQPPYEVGTAAARAAFALIKGDSVAPLPTLQLQARLIERDSVAAPPEANMAVASASTHENGPHPEG